MMMGCCRGILVQAWMKIEQQHGSMSRAMSLLRHDQFRCRNAPSLVPLPYFSQSISIRSSRRMVCRSFSRHDKSSHAPDDAARNDLPMSKQDGYSKLPRLYVGPIQSQPTSLRHMDELSNMFGGSRNAPAKETLCHNNAILSLTPDQSHYLTSVLRLGKKRKGVVKQQHVRVFDGNGGEWLAQVIVGGGEKSDRRNNAVVTVQCLEQLRPPVMHPTEKDIPVRTRQQQDESFALSQRLESSSVWLCVAPPKKKDRFRWMVEKTVELGVHGFFFIDSDFGEAPEKGTGSYSKLQAHVVEAAEQCERLDLPRIVAIDGCETTRDIDDILKQQQSADSIDRVQLEEFLGFWAEQSERKKVQLLVCRERSNSLPIWQAFDAIFATQKDEDNESVERTTPGQTAIVFLVGPEGGWSPNEEECMDELEREYPTCVCNISLGPTILRAETAAMTSVAAYNLYRDSNRLKEW
jgi:16S rRNA U1498 N3-methylase RsmE